MQSVIAALLSVPDTLEGLHFHPMTPYELQQDNFQVQL